MAINQLQHAHGLLVYPSDVYTLSYQFNSTTQSSNLYVGTGGNIRVLTAGGDDITFYNVQSGSFLPVHASKVFLTGTTASNILAMDMNLTGGGLNQETFAYLSATGITGDTEVSAVNTLVSSLKLNGLWSKMKAVYPFVTDNRNLLSYTEDFGNAYWGKGNITVTTNTTTAPNGTLTADTITPSTTTSGHAVVTNLSVISGSVVVVNSVYAKSNGYNYVGLSDNTTGQAVFNLSDGSIVSSDSGITALTPENVGNGWWRLSIRFTATTSRGLGIDVWNNSTKTPYAGNGTSGIFIWGAQLELGSTATTYQPIATTQQSYISNQFKYNLVNPIDSDAAFRLVFNGGWTMSNQGATPNGTNGYADTKLVPSSVLSSQNSQHYSMYSRTNVAESRYGFGSDDVRLGLKWGDGILYAKLGIAELGYGTNSTSLGLHLMSRTDSTNLPVFVRNTKINTVSVSSSLSGLAILLGARQLSASVDSYGSRQLAFSSIGDGLTDTEATALYNAVQTFNTSLNRAVAP